MAELLVKATEVAHEDPEKDRRARSKRGDIVEVFDDVHRGDVDRNPIADTWVILSIPGLKRQDAIKYQDRWRRPVVITEKAAALEVAIDPAFVGVRQQAALTKAEVDVVAAKIGTTASVVSDKIQIAVTELTKGVAAEAIRSGIQSVYRRCRYFVSEEIMKKAEENKRYLEITEADIIDRVSE